MPQIPGHSQFGGARVPDTRMTVLVLAICQALVMSATALMMPTSALAGKILAADDSLATLPLAVQFGSAMLSASPISFWMQRVGRRAGFLTGAALLVASGLLSACAIYLGSFALFIFASAMFGATQASSLHYRFAAAEAASADFRPKAISLVLGGGVAAAVIGPNLANLGESLLAPYTFAGGFAFLVLLGLINAGVLLASPMTGPIPEAIVTPRRPLRTIIAQPSFPPALAAAMLGYGAMAFVMTATPLAMQSCGYTFGETVFVLQLHALGMYAPSFVTGDIIKRYGEKRILLAGAGCYFATVAIGLGGIDFGNFWISLILLGVGWNFLYVGGTTLLTQCHRPSERGKVQAFNDTMVFASVALCSFTAGTIEHYWGWNAVLWLGLAPMAAILAIVLRMGRTPALVENPSK